MFGQLCQRLCEQELFSFMNKRNEMNGTSREFSLIEMNEYLMATRSEHNQSHTSKRHFQISWMPCNGNSKASNTLLLLRIRMKLNTYGRMSFRALSSETKPCMQYSQCVTDNGKSNRVNTVAKTSTIQWIIHLVV